MLKIKRILALVLVLTLVCTNVPWTVAASALTQGSEEIVAQEESGNVGVGDDLIHQVTITAPEYQLGDPIPAATDIELSVDGAVIKSVDGFEDTEHETFQRDVRYYLVLTITAPEGRAFSENFYISWNGAADWIHWDPDAQEAHIGLEYAFMSSRVETLYFDGLPAQIQAGEAVVPADFTMEGDAEIVGVQWVDEENRPVTTFENGKDYYLEFSLKPKEGYAFYDGIGAFNNATGFWSHRWGLQGPDSAVLCFKYTLKQEAGAICVDISGIAPGADVEQVSVNVSGNASFEQFRIVDQDNREDVENGELKDNKNYYCDLQLIPAEGYTFTKNTEVTVSCGDRGSWNGDVWDFGNLSVEVYYDFRAPAVERLYIEGTPETVKPGEAVIPELWVEGDAQIADIRWVDQDKQPVSVLEEGKVYFLEATLNPTKGYAFRYWVDIYCEDQTIISDNELKVYWKYSLLPDVGPVDVTITGIEPGKAVADLEVSVDGKAEVERVEIWCEGVDGEITSGDFLADHCYRIHIELRPAEGYRFTDENRPYINGTWDGDCGQPFSGEFFWVDLYFDFRAPRVEEVWILGLPEEVEPGDTWIPDLEIEGNAQITDICWVDSADNKVNTLVDGKDYYLAVTLKPAEGYAFRDWVHTNTEDYSIVDDQKLVVLIGYSLKPETGPVQVTISGLELGASVEDVTVNVNGNAQLDYLSIGDAAIGETIETGVFKKDNLYYVELGLRAADGYRFVGEMELSVEGFEYDWGISSIGSHLYIYTQLDLRAPQIEELWVDGLPEEIAAGKANIPSLSVIGNAEITSIQWIDAEGNPVTSLVTGQNYFLKVNFAPKNGFVFRDWIDIDCYSHAIVNENELEACYFYTLVPDVGLINVTVSGVEPGMPVKDIRVDVDGKATLGEIFIYNNTIGEEVVSGNFEAENTYDIRFVLHAADGYRFDEENRPIVNGDDDYSCGRDYLGTYFEIDLYCDLRTPAVNDIYVHGLPERFDLTPGAVTLPQLSVEGDAEITGVRWINADMQPVNAFAYGQDYYLEVTLKPTNGLVFRDYFGFNSFNALDNSEVISENEGVAYFYYSLKPVCENVYLNVTGLTEGKTISDLSVTVTGSAKVDRIGVWDDYTGEYLGNGKLQAGKYYMFRCELSPANGYRFGEETFLYFNGDDTAEFHADGNVLYCYYYFNTCQEIKSVELNMGKVAIGTNIADVAITAPKNADYTVKYRWVDGATWEEVNGKFQNGCKYVIEYELTPNNGFAFAKNAKVTINDVAADTWINPTGSNGQGNLTYSYYQKIDKVELPALPSSIKKGSALPGGFKVSSNMYTLDYAWVNMYDDVTEKADKDGPYVLQWVIDAAKGYEFTGNTAVYVGGKKYTSAIINESEILVFKVFNIGVSEIERIELTFPTPVAGAKPGEITAPDNAKYDLYGAYWAENATGNIFDENVEIDTFQNGKYVLFSMEMEAADGYSFAGDLEIYINGKKVADPVIMNLGLYGAFAVNLGMLGKLEPMQAPTAKVDGQMLTWDADPVATGYEIYRATSKSGKYSKVATVTQTSWQDVSASVGKTYYYKVKAVNANDTKLNSGYSNIVSMAAKCAVPVIEVHVDIESGKPVVSWTKVSGAKKYEVYRAESVDGKYTKLTTTTGLSYTDTKAAFGSESYYKVKAIASKSTYNSDYSGIWMCYTVCARPNLTVKVNVDTGKPTLSWNKITNAVGYQILRQTVEMEEFVAIAVCEGTTYEDLTANIGTTYTYKVIALAKEYDGFNSAYSKTGTAHCTLGRPQLETNVDANGKPVITWEAVEGAEGYKVYRSTSSSKGFKEVTSITEPGYTDTSVAAGKAYYYKVVAFAGSTKSAETSAVKLTGKCAIPELTVKAGSTGKPVLSWNKISGAKKYEIWRSVDGAAFKKLTTVTSTTYTDSKATEGAECTYKVKALGSSSSYNGNFSEEAGCYVTCAAPSLTAKVDTASGKPSLSWGKVTGAQSYAIYRSENGGEFQLLTTVTGTSYLDTNVEIDNSYSYYVQTIGKSEVFNSIASATKTVTVAVGQPKIKGSINDNGKPVITWEAVEDAVAYKVYRSTSSSKNYKEVVTVTDLSYIDTGVSAGKTYYYKVMAVGENSNSPQSAYVKLTGKCDVPELTVKAGSTGKPVLTWNKISGAKKYEIWRSVDGAAFKKLTTVTKTTYTDSKATNGAECTYKVKALGSSSSYNGNFSEELGCKVICAAPSLTVKIDTVTGKPSLSWSKVTGATGYVIYRSENGGVVVELPTITATSYLDTDAKTDNKYSYYVVTVGKSDVFNSIASTTKTITVAVGQPQVKGSINEEGKPVITWGAVEDAVSYKIYRSTSSSKSYKEIDTVTDLTYVDTSVAAGKTYYYKVMAVGANSNSPQSAYVKMTGKCAQPEASVSLNIKSGKPVITWEKISGAKKYEVYRATSENGKYSKIGTSTKTSYTDTKASVGTTYYYKVVAAGSKSSYNSIQSAATEAVTALMAQPSMTVKNDSKTGKPVISWGKVSGAKQYVVMYADVTEFMESETGPDEAYLEENMKPVVTTKTSVTLTDAEIGHVYLVTMVAVPKNEEYFSVPVEPQYVAATCKIPKITGYVDKEYGKPGAYWNEVEGAEGYMVYRSTKSGSGYKALGVVYEPGFIDASAVKGKTYYYKVTAVAGYSESGMSNSVKLKSK